MTQIAAESKAMTTTIAETKDPPVSVSSIRRGKIVKIGLMAFGMVAATGIITAVVMSVGFNRVDPVPVNFNGTSDPANVPENAVTTVATTAVSIKPLNRLVFVLSVTYNDIDVSRLPRPIV